MLVNSNFSFSHSIFKRLVSKGRQKVSLCGNGLFITIRNILIIVSLLSFFSSSSCNYSFVFTPSRFCFSSFVQLQYYFLLSFVLSFFSFFFSFFFFPFVCFFLFSFLSFFFNPTLSFIFHSITHSVTSVFFVFFSLPPFKLMFMQQSKNYRTNPNYSYDSSLDLITHGRLLHVTTSLLLKTAHYNWTERIIMQSDFTIRAS